MQCRPAMSSRIVSLCRPLTPWVPPKSTWALPRRRAAEGNRRALSGLTCGFAATVAMASHWFSRQCGVCEVTRKRSEPTNFAGKTAVVTGGASGLGWHIARRLIDAGAKVVLLDLNSEQLGEATAELGESAVAIPCDLRDLKQTRRALQDARVADRADLLVNCAGVALFEPYFDISEDTWNLTMDVNARATFFLSQLVAEGMTARGGGAIVNVPSQSSTVVVGPRHTCYSVSKAVVDHITRSTAINLADKNVRCNAVCPTVVRTSRAGNLHGEEGFKEMAAKIPLKRACEPDDVADVVLFLLSDRSSMITGVTVPVDGGFILAAPGG